MSVSIRGDVRCGKLPHFRGAGILHPDGTVSKKHPVLPGYTNINVSTAGTTYKALSPMLLGPLTAVEKKSPNKWFPNGIHPGFTSLDETRQQAISYNLENWWQGSKVYNIDVSPPGGPEGNMIQRSFFDRRAALMGDPKGHRRALPKKDGYPVAAYFDGNVLNYVSSRIYYISYYEQLASARPEYQELQRQVNNGLNVQIIGFDGHDPDTGADYGAHPITYEILEREMYNPKLPFGHELVLCGMLLDLRPWLNFDMQKAITIN